MYDSELVHKIAGAIYAQVFDRFNSTKPEYVVGDEMIHIAWYLPFHARGTTYDELVQICFKEGRAELICQGQHKVYEYADQEFPQNLLMDLDWPKRFVHARGLLRE